MATEQGKNGATAPAKCARAMLRVPTNREHVEVRVFAVAGPSGSEPDIVLQTFRRLSPEIGAPWGPSAAFVRVPLRFVARLVEVIEHVIEQEHAHAITTSPEERPCPHREP
jgi:hypothetical protein